MDSDHESSEMEPMSYTRPKPRNPRSTIKTGDSSAEAKYKVLVKCLANIQDVMGRKLEINFPRIISAGAQSSGKSSVIQGLIGKEFLPRGTDIVTRCPLFIRVHQTQGGEEYIKFPKEEKYKLPEETFDDYSDVVKEIDKRTDCRTKRTKNISEEEILIDIYSPKYPDLQFVDLPGFAKVAVEGQRNDIEEQVLALVLKYMQDPNTIILAVNDATQDIASSEVLKYALRQDVDPMGERTIAVLTKLDKLEPGSDTKRAVAYLKNTKLPLKYGYVGVVNRTQNQTDQNISIEESKANEQKLFKKPDFNSVSERLGIDYLRGFLTYLLASKIKEFLPQLKNEASDEFHSAEEQLKEMGEFENASESDLITQNSDLITLLVEKVIQDCKIILEGSTTKVDHSKIALGAKINEEIKKGTVESAKQAREKFSVEEFHQMLYISGINIHAIRDPLMVEELVLHKGVELMTENYRYPFKTLLEKVVSMLNAGIQNVIEKHLDAYPVFKSLISNLLIGEMEDNKKKTQEFLDELINFNKRVVNTENEGFTKATQTMRKSGFGIRFKNINYIWFKERISTDSEKHEEQENEEGSESDQDGGSDDQDHLLFDDDQDILEVGDTLTGASTATVRRKGLKTIYGFTEKLQKQENKDSHTTKFPSNISDEAMMHLDLCLQYMRIVDHLLVDQIPKFFITMMVHRTLDYLQGGNCYPTSILRQVHGKLSTPDAIANHLVKGHLHTERVSKLKARRDTCQETLKVIEETQNSLNTL